MKIEILYFQLLRTTVGTDRETVDLPDGATVATAIQAAVARHEALAPWQGSLMPAVNEEWAPRSQELTNGDHLALMPPVSGG
ncbi:MoaD/ThiS family protein [bacterium]|nr:MoaD/ThiS family protein [bacterium]